MDTAVRPLAHVTPQVTPLEAAIAFVTPAPRDPRLGFDFLPDGSTFSIDGPTGRVAAARAGHGPAVLLLHGWNGHSSDLAAFAAPLLGAGFEVIAMDLPAHGASDGDTTCLPHAAVAVQALQRQLGHRLHAVVAHSMGGAIAVRAMGAGLPVDRAVLIAAPARKLDYVMAVAAHHGFDATQTEELFAHLRERGLDVRTIDSAATARTLAQRALLLHSVDDRTVPVEDSEDIAAAWAGAELVRVDGLGHRRLLRDAAVVERVLRFVAAA